MPIWRACAEANSPPMPSVPAPGTPPPLLAALPARYAEVLHGLLDRLESGALFSEESCSFSQKDLIDSLQMWLDKAGAALPPQG